MDKFGHMLFSTTVSKTYNKIIKMYVPELCVFLLLL